MEKKLTDFQVETLIENIIQTKKENKLESLKKVYIKRLRESKSKKETFKILNELYSKNNTLIYEGYGKEIIYENFLSDIFKQGLGGSWKTVKEYVYRQILNKVNEMFGNKINDELLYAISLGLADIDLSTHWRKFLSPVKNCEFFSDAIMDGVVEYYISKKVNDTFGQTFLGDAIRNAFSDALLDQQNIQQLQDSMSKVVCTAIRSAFGAVSGQFAPSGATPPKGAPIPAVS